MEIPERHPLIISSIIGDHLAVKKLLKDGANVEVKDARYRGGGTSLHHAACFDRCKTAGILLQYGANIESRDIAGYTPLMLASKYNNIKMIELLLNNGANIAARNNEENALMIAIKGSKMDAVKILVLYEEFLGKNIKPALR